MFMSEGIVEAPTAAALVAVELTDHVKVSASAAVPSAQADHMLHLVRYVSTAVAVVAVPAVTVVVMAWAGMGSWEMMLVVVAQVIAIIYLNHVFVSTRAERVSARTVEKAQVAGLGS
jgi:ABC-type transport system involved in cytochrome bd biosynthesis fused ATPase/permease subunit